MIKVTKDGLNVPKMIELSEHERNCGRENYDFYCFLLWPFIEACWLGTVSLIGLTPPLTDPANVWVDMNKAQSNAQLVRLKPYAAVQWFAHLLTCQRM